MEAILRARKLPTLKTTAAFGERLEVRFESPKDETSGENWALGWYIFVRLNQHHRRVILVRFRRKKDAEIGMKGLQDAGLVTISRLRWEPPENVMRILCENLQW